MTINNLLITRWLTFDFQGLVTSLEHPNKLLHSIFEIIYDKDVVCEVRSKSVQAIVDKS